MKPLLLFLIHDSTEVTFQTSKARGPCGPADFQSLSPPSSAGLPRALLGFGILTQRYNQLWAPTAMVGGGGTCYKCHAGPTPRRSLKVKLEGGGAREKAGRQSGRGGHPQVSPGICPCQQRTWSPTVALPEPATLPFQAQCSVLTVLRPAKFWLSEKQRSTLL